MPRFGDKQSVEKVSGYRFPGIVLACVEKTNGNEIYLVEADHPDFAGMTHIFNENQLIERQKHKFAPNLAPTDVPIGSLWSHVDTGAVYVVTALSIDEATLEWLVSYTPVDRSSLIWTRKYDVFKTRFKP